MRISKQSLAEGNAVVSKFVAEIRNSAPVAGSERPPVTPISSASAREVPKGRGRARGGSEWGNVAGPSSGDLGNLWRSPLTAAFHWRLKLFPNRRAACILNDMCHGLGKTREIEAAGASTGAIRW